MKANEMLENLIEQSEKLKEDLLKLEQEFNLKKEHYIKIQGAIEVLNELEQSKEEKNNL